MYSTIAIPFDPFPVTKTLKKRSDFNKVYSSHNFYLSKGRRIKALYDMFVLSQTLS